MKIELKASGDL